MSSTALTLSDDERRANVIDVTHRIARVRSVQEVARHTRAMAAQALKDEAERHRALIAHHAGKRRAAKMRRTPPWADLEAIRAMYEEARRLTRETGVKHHVDHEIPLQGELVSGLHVHNNLQILTGSQNSRKRNRYEVA